MTKTKRLGGDQVLYPYLQKELVDSDLWLSQLIAARLVVALGIWFHPSTYRELPVFLPHVIRDSSARRSRGGQEEWGSPNPEGLLRDDNSLIKNAVKSLRIESHRTGYRGARIGNGWVAAHVWEMRRDGERTTRHHETNSFLPNLVWLPSWLARMSDRPGSFVQEFLQAMSHHLYSTIAVNPPRDTWAHRAWAQLEIPSIPKAGLPPLGDLNFFEDSDRWRARREGTVREVVRTLKGGNVPSLKPTRYRDGILGVKEAHRSSLAEALERYLDAV